MIIPADYYPEAPRQEQVVAFQNLGFTEEEAEQYVSLLSEAREDPTLPPLL